MWLSDSGKHQDILRQNSWLSANMGKYLILTRQNYGNKVSCTFNMSVLQVAFTVHNLSTGDENDYGVHIELGLARNPLKDVVALRLEGNCNIKFGYSLKSGTL